jgi:hypothetical protein
MATQNCGITAVVIPAGGTIVVPAGATIISHTASDPTLLATPCPDLEEQLGDAEDFECYEFAMEGDLDDSGNNAGSFNIDEVTIVEMQMGTTVYPLNKLLQDIGQVYDILKVSAPFMKFSPTHSNSGGNYGPYHSSSYNKRVTITLAFATAPSLAERMRLKLSNGRNNDGGGGAATYYVYARPKLSNTGHVDCPI